MAYLVRHAGLRTRGLNGSRLTYIKAPEEGEAQCAALVKTGEVFAVGTERMLACRLCQHGRQMTNVSSMTVDVAFRLKTMCADRNR